MSFFVKEVVGQEWGIYYELTGAGYGGLVAALVILLLAGCVVSGRGGERKISTKQLVFSAMAIALAMATSMIKLADMPMGGSVTLCSMLFICLVGCFFGLWGGLMAAVAYGILQLVVDPYIISIPQLLTDYIFGFGALGLSGIFCNKKHGLVLGYLAGALGRYFFTVLSGMIFFGSYAANFHMSALAYPLAYNGAYLGPEVLATVAVLSLPPVARGLGRVKGMARGH